MSVLPVDAHAHVFSGPLALAAGRRYTPRGKAPIADFLGLLDRHRIGAGVLVQPSFLGIDNRYLIDSLAAAPDRLRGIAVVDPAVTDRTIEAFAAAGIAGIRFNLIGDDLARIGERKWRELADRVSARGWQIEIQAEGRDLPVVLDALAGVAAPLVIDHFGRPDPALGVRDPGFQRLLTQGTDGQIWVKLSGAYRCGGVDVRAYVDALLERLGPERLLWGSDWPWTQFESGRDYASCIAEFIRWCDPSTRNLIAAAARRLFRLPAA